MINRHRLLTAVIAASALSWSGTAVAQSAALAPLRSSSNIDGNGEKIIRGVVAGHLQKMDPANPSSFSAARDALVSDAVSESQTYKEKYAAAVAEEIASPPIAESPDARKRLNAAVALARIAANTQSGKLQPAVLALLGPKQPEAVQLWALKAAGSILPDTLKNDPQKTLLKSIVPAVKERLSSPMSSEAYAALSVPKEASGPAVIDEILNLLELRVELYKSQPHLIDEATVDYGGLQYILGQTVWTDPNLVPQPQKVRTMQAVCDLVTLSAQLGDAAVPGTPEREQFQLLALRVIGSVYVAATVSGAQDLAKVANLIHGQLKTQGVQLSNVVRPLCPAIQQTNGFQQIKPMAGANP